MSDQVASFERPERILVLFVDGVGVGPTGPLNPFSEESLPALHHLLGGKRLVAESFSAGVAVHDPTWVVRLLDPTLGMPGRPQSGTGQTALLTGVNAAARFGRHFGPWVPTPLRDLFANYGFLRRLAARGRTAALLSAVAANAPIGGAGRRPAAAPLAALGASLPLRSAGELQTGVAVAGSFHTERWRQHHPSVPRMSVEEGAVRLGTLAGQVDLGLFAHYDTDIAGHARALPTARTAVAALDRALGALVPSLPTGTLLILCSDHGNLEDASTGHTLNPVPLIALGPGAEAFTGARSILDISPIVTGLLSEGAGEPRQHL